MMIWMIYTILWTKIVKGLKLQMKIEIESPKEMWIVRFGILLFFVVFFLCLFGAWIELRLENISIRDTKALSDFFINCTKLLEVKVVLWLAMSTVGLLGVLYFIGILVKSKNMGGRGR